MDRPPGRTVPKSHKGKVILVPRGDGEVDMYTPEEWRALCEDAKRQTDELLRDVLISRPKGDKS